VREILSFVVRIYRRDGGVLAGLVEQVRSGKTAAFGSEAELSDLLSGRRSFSRRPIRHRRADDPASAASRPSTPDAR
jgi:hypothetical protein